MSVLLPGVAIRKRHSAAQEPCKSLKSSIACYSDPALWEKNLGISAISDCRDPSSPSAPQDDTRMPFFSNFLKIVQGGTS